MSVIEKKLKDRLKIEAKLIPLLPFEDSAQIKLSKKEIEEIIAHD
jgi:hypothetical protein